MVYSLQVPDLLDYLRSTYALDAKITYDELFNRSQDGFPTSAG